jgi:hypothetical protein
MRNFNLAFVGGCLLLGLVILGCEAKPTPVATPAPPPPPAVAPAPAPPATPTPVTLPPTLVAKVEELTRLYKQLNEPAASTAADPTDLDALEKRLASTQQLGGKIQTLLLEINAAQAELTPEQRAEFLKQHGSKLVPPTPAIPVAPPASP